MATSAAPGLTTVTPSSKPTQIKFLRPAMMALFARVATYPPLGQVTVVPPSRQQFNFTVVIESSQSLPEQPWEVAIWYDHGSYSYSKSPWKDLLLQKVSTGPAVLHDQRSSKLYRYTFEGNLPSPFPDNGRTYKGRHVPFTVRYRTQPSGEWQWVGDNFGTRDGEVILQPPIDPNYLGDGPVELKQGWYARKLNSEAPGARLYFTESSSFIPISQDGDGKEESLVLGHVISACRWFALVRIWEPWLAPRHGERGLRLTEPAILLAFLRSDGQHVVLLALNGMDECMTTFKSDSEGNIVVCARNDTGKDRRFKLLAAIAWSFEVANAAVMYEMRKYVRQSSAYQEASASLLEHVKTSPSGSDLALVNNDDNREPAYDDAPTPTWLTSWYDSLAYCTWNSLGQDLNAEKIMAGLDSFAKNKIYVTNLIIDDNWQSLTGEQGKTSQFQRGWTDFEANPIGFPGGLKAAMTRIRDAHPQIRDIGVWHALMGYWGGVSPDQGSLHQKYKLREVTFKQKGPAAGVKHVVDPSDIHRMYDDFYTFLSESGVTAVKTDVQFYLDLLESSTDRRDLTIPYQSAWTQAHLRHLSGKAISCMSQIPQILFHSFLPTNTPRIMLRNSDDFFPDVPASHPWHVFANAHTSLFVQHLNVLPDWDMFQTSHAYSGFHAAARCVSGGPIYVTDTPGEHDVNLIHEMTALNPKQETIVLRPSNVGKTLGIYDSYEDGSVLKVGVYDGRAEVGTGMMGLFNIAESDVAFILPVAKIPGVVAIESDSPGSNGSSPQRKWIIRSHKSRKITRPIAPTIPPRGDSLLEATLPVRGYDIWSALPVRGPFDLAQSKSIEVAIIGLLGKMTGACAIIQSSFQVTENGQRLRIDVNLKALGILGVWVSDASARKVDDLLVTIKGKPISPERVKITTDGVDSSSQEADKSAQPGVIEVDIQGAWEDMKIDPGYNNELGVEIWIS